MSGIMCAMMGSSGGMVMSAAYAQSGFKTTTYFTGYSDGTLTAAGAFGSISSPFYGGTTVQGLWWESTASSTTGGQVYITFPGNRSAGFLSSVTSNGTSLGSIGSPIYYSSVDQTQFPVGGNAVNVPFSSGSSYNIVVS